MVEEILGSEDEGIVEVAILAMVAGREVGYSWRRWVWRAWRGRPMTL